MTKINNFIANNLVIKNYRRMWPFVKPFWFRALIGVLLTIPVGSLDAAIAMFLKPFMDNVMVNRQPRFSAALPFLIIGFTVLQGILNYTSSYVNTWVGGKITIGIKRKLYDKLLSMDSAYFDKNDSGTILFRYSSDAEIASAGLIDNLKLFLSKFFSSISLVFVLVYNSWQLAILAVGVLVFAVYPLKVVRKKITSVAVKTVGVGSNIMTIYNETFHGNKIIHSFTLEETLRERFKKTTDFMFTLAIKMVQGSNWLSPVMHLISSIGVALVISCGSFLIVRGDITSGNFVAFIAALLLLYTPLKTIGNNYIAIQQSFLAVDRIFDILSLTPGIKSKDGDAELSSIRKNIEFKNVGFSYNSDKKVLNNINFNIHVGQTVALVGNSGGGKTTISSLIPRLYEIQEGEILIDGTDIKKYQINSLRKNIAVVFQDNFLFSGTIRENLMLGNPLATEEDIRLAVHNAYLDDFVDSLPGKLNTQIGERGVMLSGGQKQRVAIARAFIKNAPLVILDEATSALDNKAEKIVQRALDNLMKNRTVIVIAHRLSTIQNADKILVINDGHIIEHGTHGELIDLHGAYFALYNSQFKTQEVAV
ncbi:MAG: ATP-binding cassette domain-containing protein [Elusimicrobium sp.]|jgi:subfamily B ATP-binding cassette protein MsbA|nr:ATP-binding cassette domain-containing protein [Elusimicrobium sp.]